MVVYLGYLAWMKLKVHLVNLCIIVIYQLMN